MIITHIHLVDILYGDRNDIIATSKGTLLVNNGNIFELESIGNDNSI